MKRRSAASLSIDRNSSGYLASATNPAIHDHRVVGFGNLIGLNHTMLGKFSSYSVAIELATLVFCSSSGTKTTIAPAVSLGSLSNRVTSERTIMPADMNEATQTGRMRTDRTDFSLMS